MGVDQAGQNNLARTIDLRDLVAVFRQPGIEQGVFGAADGDDLSAEAENGAIGDQAEFFKGRAAAWAGCGRTEGQKLADAGEKYCRYVSRFRFPGRAHA